MNKKNFGLIFSISLILSSITLLEAKEYSSDRYGNTNINVIDGVVIVNDKIESVLDNNEQLSIDIDGDGDSYEDYGISVDDEVGVMIESEDYGISVDNEVDVMVKIGDSSIIVDDDDISVDIGGLLDIGGLITID